MTNIRLINIEQVKLRLAREAFLVRRRLGERRVR
jgi:hypothetical protein